MEFNLSEKQKWIALFPDDKLYPEEDVKEFIRKIKEDILTIDCCPLHAREALNKHIDKLAGDKLR